MTDKIDFHSGRLKRAYEQDKNFYNILSGLSLATLIALISIVDDTNKNKVKDLSLETRGYVSVVLDSKDQIDESNDELLKEQDLEAEEGEGLIDADSLLEETLGYR